MPSCKALVISWTDASCGSGGAFRPIDMVSKTPRSLPLSTKLENFLLLLGIVRRCSHVSCWETQIWRFCGLKRLIVSIFNLGMKKRLVPRTLLSLLGWKPFSRLSSRSSIVSFDFLTLVRISQLIMVSDWWLSGRDNDICIAA